MTRTNAEYIRRVRRKYNGILEIWQDHDRWHMWSKHQIELELARVWTEIGESVHESSIIVDVGSAGRNYLPAIGFRIDVDIAERTIRQCAHPVCANAEMLPFKSNIADILICVGPVANYCSLDELINEIKRITKPNSLIIIHVELSNSWEFFGKSAFRQDVAFVDSFYEGVEQYWVYSDKYVERVLRINGFQIKRKRIFHILSSVAYRLSLMANFSARFAVADVFLQKFPSVAGLADSAIYVARREA